MLENIIKELKPKLKELFSDDKSGHDISHLERVYKTALTIQEMEGGDRLVIGLSAYLHDIHRLIGNKTGEFCEPADSLDMVRELLKDVQLTDEQLNKILFAIGNHELYNWNGNNVDDLETLVLQDADNLDAIGAIGIARTFIYHASKNDPLYDDSIPFDESNDFHDSKSDPSTIHHFYHKLFKLDDNMNTETGKQMAEQQVKFMKQFVEQFLNEWNGKYTLNNSDEIKLS